MFPTHFDGALATNQALVVQIHIVEHEKDSVTNLFVKKIPIPSHWIFTALSSSSSYMSYRQIRLNAKSMSTYISLEIFFSIWKHINTARFLQISNIGKGQVFDIVSTEVKNGTGKRPRRWTWKKSIAKCFLLLGYRAWTPYMELPPEPANKCRENRFMIEKFPCKYCWDG